MNKRVFFLLWLAIICAIVAASSGLKFDSDLWLSRDHPLEKHIDYLDEEFEKGETLFLIISPEKNFFSDPLLFSAISALENRLSLIPGVISSRSPMSAKTVIQSGDSLQIRSFQNALETGFIKDAGHFQALFTESPYHGRLLSEDGKTVSIQMRVDTRRRAGFRNKLFEAVKKEIGDSRFPQALLSGDAALQAEINRTVRNELFFLLAAGAGVVAVFLLVFMRNRFHVAVLMTCLVIAVAQSFATVNLLGHSFTPVSLSLPLMVAVIVIADGLHIFSIWDREIASAGGSPLGSTISKTWLPCLITSLTSAVGFGAFSVSKLIPVSNFGIDSLVAIILCYPLLIATAWGALWMFPSPMSSSVPKDGGRITSPVLRSSRRFLAREKKTALVFGFLSLFLASSLIYARTETNFLNVLFKKSSRIAQAFDLADRKLGGSGSVEIVVEGETPMHFHKIENFKRVKKLIENFNSNPFVNNSDSYLLPLEITHRPLSNRSNSVLPRNGDELAQELFFLELSRGEREKDLVSPYLNFNSSTARIEAQTPNLNSSKLGSLIDFVKLRSSEIFPDANVVVTGSGAYTHQLSRYVISTQVRSFALTFAVIGIVFISVFGLRFGMAGFISNMFPVLVATGMISLLEVPFDFATVLVAGIILGLSVDDSIHFLYHCKKAEKVSPDTGEAIEKSLSIVTRPVVLTSLLFCAALAVLCSSSLVVMVKFALFTIAGLIAAMISALVFLPSLVKIFRKNPQTVK